MTGTALLDFAMDTMIGTTVLIAAALLLRRPVARFFGPRAAYALWLLPLARLVMPPLVLPAWIGPYIDPGMARAAASAEPVATALPVDTVAPVAVPAAMGDPAPALIAPEILTSGLVAIWLGVAIAFLVWRWRSYHAMRRMLLVGARRVGQFEDIRMVETAAVEAPVAFGVLDKVIAMPIGYMANADREGRDLAIAHEIAHHRGHDLLANIAAQPLIALHWFNPLAWAGWRAMRRDQEAACDARVIDTHADGGRDGATRARYGQVIAAAAKAKSQSPALSSPLAIAAPMAGFREIAPRLGEKAIVHRLRSLAMSPSRLRRRLGIGLVSAAALVAIPLTASVSYAEAEQSTVSSVPVPPSAPAAPAAPEAPLPPEAPAAPEAPEVADGKHFVWISEEDGASEDGKIRKEVRVIHKGEMTEAERMRFEAEIERATAEATRAGVEAAKAGAEAAKVHAYAHAQTMRVAANAPEVEEKISADGKVRTIRVFKTIDGNRELVSENIIDEGAIHRDAMKAAIRGIMAARASLATSTSLSAEERAEVLAELDSEIAELKAEMAEHN